MSETENPIDVSVSESANEPIHVTDADHLSQIVDANDVVLADFFAAWCGPCQMLEPVVKSIAAQTDAAVAKVDVDVHRDLAATYRVQGVPTMVLFADGDPVEHMVGFRDEASLTQLVERYTE